MKWTISVMNDAVIGYTGFVGSYLMREGMDVYNTSNIASLGGKAYDVVYCSALPAEKWKANKNPIDDKKNTELLMNALRGVTCNTFVLISTVDVYDTRFPQCEEADISPNIYSVQPYGIHRREFEEWALKTFANVHIFRLPALFGHGLKKNALYDMMHDNQVNALRSHWVFHWYALEWLWDDIQSHMSAKHSVVNLVTPPISLSTLQKLLFPGLELSDDPQPTVRYAISSKYGYSHSVEDVLVSMAEYVRYVPRLMVSEIGWDPAKESMFLSYLRRNGIQQREIVPSKRDWKMQSYTNVYSAQSILYGVDIQIFKEQSRFISLLAQRMAALSNVGTKIVVFGSPKQRLYSGEDAISLFRDVGDICRVYDITLCLENNSRLYGGNWLCTLKDTLEFVKAVNHPNIRVNLDTGSMMMEDEVHVSDIKWIGHVQVSFPQLGPWQDNASLPLIFAQLGGYTGNISLEMLHVDFRSIDNFVKQDWLHLKDTRNLSA